MVKTLKSILVIAGALAATTAFAHHGWGGYDREIRTSMTITKVRWINPHDLLYATAEDGTEWTLLLAPPVRNRRYGFGPGTVEVGDVVEILAAGHPSRNEAKVHVITRGGEEVYRYLYSEDTDSLEKLGGTTQKPRAERRSD